MELVEAMEESEELHVVEIDQMTEELEVVQVHGEAVRFLPRWNSILVDVCRTDALSESNSSHVVSAPASWWGHL